MSDLSPKREAPEPLECPGAPKKAKAEPQSVSTDLGKDPDRRLQGKKWFLTYSNLNEFVFPPEQRYDKLVSEFADKFCENMSKRGYEVDWYVAGFEKHESDKWHCHVLVAMEEKLRTTDMRVFDVGPFTYYLEGDMTLEQEYLAHPNIQPCKRLMDCLKYVTKEDQYVAYNVGRYHRCQGFCWIPFFDLIVNLATHVRQVEDFLKEIDAEDRSTDYENDSTGSLHDFIAPDDEELSYFSSSRGYDS